MGVTKPKMNGVNTQENASFCSQICLSAVFIYFFGTKATTKSINRRRKKEGGAFQNANLSRPHSIAIYHAVVGNITE